MTLRAFHAIATGTLLLLGAASSLFCQSASVDTASIRNGIRAVIARQEMDWNSGSIEKYMTGYAKGDSVRFASGGSVSYGWETMLKRYRKGYPDAAAMGKLSFGGIDIAVISDDAAVAFGKWELERKGDHPWGYFTLLFRKTAEGWRIVHDHTSSANPK